MAKSLQREDLLPDHNKSKGYLQRSINLQLKAAERFLVDRCLPSLADEHKPKEPLAHTVERIQNIFTGVAISITSEMPMETRRERNGRIRVWQDETKSVLVQWVGPPPSEPFDLKNLVIAEAGTSAEITDCEFAQTIANRFVEGVLAGNLRIPNYVVPKRQPDGSTTYAYTKPELPRRAPV